jgi:hypothetical protein
MEISNNLFLCPEQEVVRIGLERAGFKMSSSFGPTPIDAFLHQHRSTEFTDKIGNISGIEQRKAVAPARTAR